MAKRKARKQAAKPKAPAEAPQVVEESHPGAPPLYVTPSGKPLPFGSTEPKAPAKVTVPADGTLIRGDGGPVVYVMEGGKKRPLQNALVFAACGFGWNEIVVLSPEEIDAIPVGDVVARQADLQGKGT